MENNPTIAFHTLGCKLNYSETSSLARMVELEGFVKRPFEEEADIYVINTCSVTDNADKSRGRTAFHLRCDGHDRAAEIRRRGMPTTRHDLCCAPQGDPAPGGLGHR